MCVSTIALPKLTIWRRTSELDSIAWMLKTVRIWVPQSRWVETTGDCSYLGPSVKVSGNNWGPGLHAMRVHILLSASRASHLLISRSGSSFHALTKTCSESRLGRMKRFLRRKNLLTIIKQCDLELARALQAFKFQCLCYGIVHYVNFELSHMSSIVEVTLDNRLALIASRQEVQFRLILN